MKKLIRLRFAAVIIFGLVVCAFTNVQATEKVGAVPERPIDAELQAFKVYHHAVYMVPAVEASMASAARPADAIPLSGVPAS